MKRNALGFTYAHIFVRCRDNSNLEEAKKLLHYAHVQLYTETWFFFIYQL